MHFLKEEQKYLGMSNSAEKEEVLTHQYLHRGFSSKCHVPCQMSIGHL